MTVLARRTSTPPLVPLQDSLDRECISRQAALGEGRFDAQHAGGEPSCLVRRFVRIEVSADRLPRITLSDDPALRNEGARPAGHGVKVSPAEAGRVTDEVN